MVVVVEIFNEFIASPEIVEQNSKLPDAHSLRFANQKSKVADDGIEGSLSEINFLQKSHD